MLVKNSCCIGGSRRCCFFLVLWRLLGGPGLECAYAVSVSITEPEDPEIFQAYDEDEEDHDWSVDFTASGAPAAPDGMYRWYHGKPPHGALRKSGTAGEGGGPLHVHSGRSCQAHRVRDLHGQRPERHLGHAHTVVRSGPDGVERRPGR